MPSRDSDLEKEARISVHVQPGAPKSEVTGCAGGLWRLKIAAPPREGRANRELIRFLSEKLGIAKSRISIVKGENARDKVVAIYGLGEEEVKIRLR